MKRWFLTIRVDAEDIERLEAVAKDMKVTKSDLVREYIRERYAALAKGDQ
jgi:predicted DNA-binding protein